MVPSRAPPRPHQPLLALDSSVTVLMSPPSSLRHAGERGAAPSADGSMCDMTAVTAGRSQLDAAQQSRSLRCRRVSGLVVAMRGHGKSRTSRAARPHGHRTPGRSPCRSSSTPLSSPSGAGLDGCDGRHRTHAAQRTSGSHLESPGSLSTWEAATRTLVTRLFTVISARWKPLGDRPVCQALSAASPRTRPAAKRPNGLAPVRAATVRWRVLSPSSQ